MSEGSPWVLSRTRRSLEFFVALLGIIALIPVMVCVGIMIRLDSPGPILFRQKRMGRNGRDFVLLKFRSMRVNDGTTSCVTASRDSRITQVGAILRRYKLDEMPQLWNVLRGDIGLVGPRPKLPHLEPLHMNYRPGITGAATLAFRHEEDLLTLVPQEEIERFYTDHVKPAKAYVDLDYMRAATLASDVRVIWRTLTACFRNESQDELIALMRLLQKTKPNSWRDDGTGSLQVGTPLQDCCKS